MGTTGLGRCAALLVGLLSASGCIVGTDESESTDAREDGAENGVFHRVVIARAYQHAEWTLPNTASVVRDAHYVCDVLASTQPTLVSGLIRLQGKHKNDKGEMVPRDEVTPEELAFYDGVRSCMKNEHGLSGAHFDVVLNATQYETATEVKNHLSHIVGALHPDAIYFDFYQRGHALHPTAIEGAIDWIRGEGLLVGGTVWGQNVPPHSDYVALDDFDDLEPQGGTHDGWTRMTNEAAALHQSHPGLQLLFHIENNPTGKENNHGEEFIGWDSQHRIDLLEKHAGHQADIGYHYMYPVFFPLSRHRSGQLAQFPDDNRVLAYDVFLDPPVYDKTVHLMDKFNAVSGGDKGGGGKKGGKGGKN